MMRWEWERWDEGDGFWGDGWVRVEWGKFGKGGKVGTYLAYLTLNMIFFLWEDGWLDGDLLIMQGLKNGIVDEMDVFG